MNMSQRPMLDNQMSGVVDDYTGNMLPSLSPTNRRVDMEQFDFGDGNESDDAADGDTDGEEGGNEQIEEIYR